MRTLLSLALILLLMQNKGDAIDIIVDYTFDTNNFFDTQEKRDAMQAVADRYSRVITSTLTEVDFDGTETGTGAGWRIGFLHPGTGATFEISTAADEATDPLILEEVTENPAEKYGFDGIAGIANPLIPLPSNEWILFAGGRSLGTGIAGIGGTGAGTNATETFNDIVGPLHRGVNDNTLGPLTSNDLPRWGGAISFNSNANWHFDHTSIPPSGTVDFYSIAIHEVGHALGLATRFNQWPVNNSGNYNGPQAISAFNSENPFASSVSELLLADQPDNHFARGAQKSDIFNAGEPNKIGIVPYSLRQNLLMEPNALFTGLQRRLELTHVDVRALRDLGWFTLSQTNPDISQPDHRVGISTFSAVGNDIYNTPTGQTTPLTSRKAKRVAGVLAVQNDSDFIDEFTVVSTASNRFFRITYFHGGANITANVITGSHTTGEMVPGNLTHNIFTNVKPNKKRRKKVTRKNGKRRVKFRRKSITLLFRSVSVNDPRGQDFSRIRVRAK
jgi:hypothetical protein